MLLNNVKRVSDGLVAEGNFMESASVAYSDSGNSRTMEIHLRCQQPCEVIHHADGSVTLAVIGTWEGAEVREFLKIVAEHGDDNTAHEF
jgi:hypothetical protein